MSQTPATRTLPIGTAALALGVTRDNLYKHIERGRGTINGIPFSAQQGPDKRWKVTIPVDMSPYLTPEELEEASAPEAEGDDLVMPSAAEQIAQLLAELDAAKKEHQRLTTDLTVARAERDSYRGMIEATHHATLTTLERVVERLAPPPPPQIALPEPEPVKKKGFWGWLLGS